MVKLYNGGLFCRFTFGWTKEGIEYLYEHGEAIYADDFAGYVFVPSPKIKTGVAVSTMGVYVLFSTDPQNPLVTLRQESRVRRWLLRKRFIRYTKNDPFPEFEPYNDIRIDTDKMRRINGNFFSTIVIKNKDGSEQEVYTHQAEEDNDGTETPA